MGIRQSVQPAIKVHRNDEFNANVLTLYKCPLTKERYGRQGDGGYVVAALPTGAYDLFLAAGVGPDITFEVDFCNKHPNVPCLLFDGTVTGLPYGQQHPNIQFYQKNIGPQETDTETNLHQVISGKQNIFLKMDIEGAEFPWLQSLSDDQLSAFAQMVLEFHNPKTQQHQRIFEALNRTHYLVHFHVNNCVMTVTTHQGLPVPNIFECTYLHKKFFPNKPDVNDETLPTELDTKNCHDNPNFHLFAEPFVFHPKQVVIRVFCDFDSSENCKLAFERTMASSPLYGRGKRFFFTSGDDYTHAIILNTDMPRLKLLPKQHVLGLACEPWPFLEMTNKFVQYARKWIGKYYIDQLGPLGTPFEEHHGFLWHYAPPKPITQKTKLMSIILSGRKVSPNHRYRHELVSHIVREQLPIDIWGRGAHLFNFNRVKGSFTDSSLPYQDYYFTIVIENFCLPHYISEKLTSPLMYNCKPLYYGCHNVFKYFENIILLTGQAQSDLQIIKQVLANPAAYYQYTTTPKNKKAACLLEHLNTIW